VGQRLQVKGRSRSVASSRYKRYHRVRRGENLTMIAKRYGTSVKRIKRLNGMRSGTIYVGQKLKLMPGNTVAKTKVRRYKIRRGDNLYKIAKKFGLTIRTLKRINNLRSNRILRGQYLKVAVN
jgi:LysM repeat protein